MPSLLFSPIVTCPVTACRPVSDRQRSPLRHTARIPAQRPLSPECTRYRESASRSSHRRCLPPEARHRVACAGAGRPTTTATSCRPHWTSCPSSTSARADHLNAGHAPAMLCARREKRRSGSGVPANLRGSDTGDRDAGQTRVGSYTLRTRPPPTCHLRKRR